MTASRARWCSRYSDQIRFNSLLYSRARWYASASISMPTSTTAVGSIQYVHGMWTVTWRLLLHLPQRLLLHLLMLHRCRQVLLPRFLSLQQKATRTYLSKRTYRQYINKERRSCGAVPYYYVCTCISYRFISRTFLSISRMALRTNVESVGFVGSVREMVSLTLHFA